MTRRERSGKQMADALIEFIHMMYQKRTAKEVIIALITQLQERKQEFD